MDKKTFFNEMAATWDQHFYTPAMKEGLQDLVSLFRPMVGRTSQFVVN